MPKFSARLRRRLRAWLGLDSVLFQTSREQATLRAELERHAHNSAAFEPVLEWIRGAEAHLAALQAADDERRKSTLAESQALFDWIKGAERHLEGLQIESEHLRAKSQQQAAQLMRVIARTSLLEARLGDLERADTSIAAAIARSRIAPLRQ